MSQKGCTLPALLGVISSSTSLDIRNNVTRECTPPAILRLISSSRPLDVRNHIAGMVYILCEIRRNTILSTFGTLFNIASYVGRTRVINRMFHQVRFFCFPVFPDTTFGEISRDSCGQPHGFTLSLSNAVFFGSLLN